MVLDEVVAKLPGVHVFVVWLPVLDGDDQALAQKAAAKWPRVPHYWDGGAQLGHALARALKLPPRENSAADGIAWDIYLVYKKGAKWSQPVYWQHQLEQVKDHPVLDGKSLRAELQTLLR